MGDQIVISTKNKEKGDYGHKIISVRMKSELVDKLDRISEQSNRSRNEIINILLESAIERVDIQ